MKIKEQEAEVQPTFFSRYNFLSISELSTYEKKNTFLGHDSSYAIRCMEFAIHMINCNKMQICHCNTMPYSYYVKLSWMVRECGKTCRVLNIASIFYEFPETWIFASCNQNNYSRRCEIWLTRRPKCVVNFLQHYVLSWKRFARLNTIHAEMSSCADNAGSRAKNCIVSAKI